jgi:hypothetical protein
MPTRRLEEIRNQLEVSKDKVGYHDGCDRIVIAGKNGYVYEDEIDPSVMRVYVSGRSKRHWSSIKKQLSFMRLLKDEGQGGHFSVAGPDLLPGQAASIRKVLKLNKRPTIAAERKEALRKHIASVRPPAAQLAGGTLSKVA